MKALPQRWGLPSDRGLYSLSLLRLNEGLREKVGRGRRALLISIVNATYLPFQHV